VKRGGGAAFWLLPLVFALHCDATPSAPNVGPVDAEPPAKAAYPAVAVVIVIDTLRADSLRESFTPRIDALAGRGSTAELAWSSSTWTAPSVMSLFTGMPLREHGWDFPFPNRMDKAAQSYPPMVDTPVLAQVLGDAGFQTQGFFANPFLKHELGFGRGFDEWTFARDEQIPRRVRRAVKAWEPGERHLLYVHLFGPHMPLHPDQEHAARWGVEEHRKGRKGGYAFKGFDGSDPEAEDHYRRAYNAVIEQTDTVVGRVLRALGRHRKDAVIVLTSDHGELLGEHGRWGHGQWLWEPVTQVPFLAVGAGELPRALSTASLPAIVTRAVGVSHTWPTAADASFPLVAQREGKLALTTDGRYKGLWDTVSLPAPGFAIYDLDADPSETVPLPSAPSDPVAARAVWETRTPSRTLEALDGGMNAETIDMLDELGYLDD
jgi:hypothetical protein